MSTLALARWSSVASARSLRRHATSWERTWEADTRTERTVRGDAVRYAGRGAVERPTGAREESMLRHLKVVENLGVMHMTLVPGCVGGVLKPAACGEVANVGVGVGDGDDEIAAAMEGTATVSPVRQRRLWVRRLPMGFMMEMRGCLLQV